MGQRSKALEMTNPGSSASGAHACLLPMGPWEHLDYSSDCEGALFVGSLGLISSLDNDEMTARRATSPAQRALRDFNGGSGVNPWLLRIILRYSASAALK